MVDMHSSMGMELAIMVERFLTLAWKGYMLTPLSRPQAQLLPESFRPLSFLYDRRTEFHHVSGCKTGLDTVIVNHRATP